MSPPSWRAVGGWEKPPPDLEGRDVPGVAVDHADNVYIITRDARPVRVYSPDGILRASWGEGIFTRLHSIRIDPAGNVWCVDDGDHTVRKFSPDGQLLMTLGEPHAPSDNGTAVVAGQPGFDYRQVARGGPPFHAPTDVCVLSDGTMFVTDGYGNARVHRFSAQGELELSWGAPGEGAGQFRVPHAIVVAPDEQRLFVADRENDRIQVFDLEGAILDEWVGFARPCGLALDARAGLLCVGELGEVAGRWPHMGPARPDSQHGRATICDLDGEIVTRWGTPDPSQAGSFYAAHGAAFDSRGDLYVSEVSWSAGARRGQLPDGWHTLQKFERSTPAAASD